MRSFRRRCWRVSLLLEGDLDLRFNLSDSTLSTSYFNPPSRIPFSRIILVDPPIWSKEKDGQDSEIYKMVEVMTPVRKDIWKSVEDASKWLKARVPWGSWDERVFDAYVVSSQLIVDKGDSNVQVLQKYGLRSLPTAYYPDKTGTTLTTHRLAENIAFTGKLFSYDALNRLNQICAHVPVHLIFGDNADMLWVIHGLHYLVDYLTLACSERPTQESIINPQEGRVFASVTRLEDAGHLVGLLCPSYYLLVTNGLNEGGPRSPYQTCFCHL